MGPNEKPADEDDCECDLRCESMRALRSRTEGGVGGRGDAGGGLTGKRESTLVLPVIEDTERTRRCCEARVTGLVSMPLAAADSSMEARRSGPTGAVGEGGTAMVCARAE